MRDRARSKEASIRLARKLMSEYEPVPVGTSGQISVENKHVSGELTVVGIREAMFAGKVPCKVKVSGYMLQKLQEGKKGVWMTNQPCELVQMWDEFAGRARGRVLIGGLGLGVVTKMVAAKDNVISVTVVEKSPDVIKLVGPHVDKGHSKTTVVQGDINKAIKSIQPGEYDWCYLDTWCENGEWVWQSQVVPMLRALRPKIKNIRCWQESVMLGQVSTGLARAADMPEKELKSRSHCHWYAFRRAVVKAGLRDGPRIFPQAGPEEFGAVFEIEEENRRDPWLQLLAANLTQLVGTPLWERQFGAYWDEAWAAKNG